MDTPNYNQTTVAGDSWQRVFSVHIDNPLFDPANQAATMPSLTMVEERVYVIGGKTIREQLATLTRQFDPANPRHGRIYNDLNDEYIEMRTIRDNTPPAP